MHRPAKIGPGAGDTPGAHHAGVPKDTGPPGALLINQASHINWTQRGSPDQQRRLEGIQVHTDLAEAALECGFALLRLARAHSQAGVRGDAERALQEASGLR